MVESIDPKLKALVEANSDALAALLKKIEAGETVLTDEIASVRATDADLKSIVSGPPPAPEPPAPSPAD